MVRRFNIIRLAATSSEFIDRLSFFQGSLHVNLNLMMAMAQFEIEASFRMCTGDQTLPGRTIRRKPFAECVPHRSAGARFA